MVPPEIGWSIKANNTADCTVTAVFVVRVCCDFAKIEAFLHGSAVVQPIGDHAAHIGRAAVEHTAAVDYLADRPPVIAAVLLLAKTPPTWTTTRLPLL